LIPGLASTRLVSAGIVGAGHIARGVMAGSVITGGYFAAGLDDQIVHKSHNRLNSVAGQWAIALGLRGCAVRGRSVTCCRSAIVSPERRPVREVVGVGGGTGPDGGALVVVTLAHPFNLSGT
jgi:hypothetical protein